MSQQTAHKFIEALQTLERDRDVEPMTALYAEDSRIGNIIASDKFHGSEGARQFWTEYRDSFETMESRFRNVLVTEDLAALEWTTQATSPASGSDGISYIGVSILEMHSDKITRFCAYFNPSELGHQIVG